jgi:hypothetical protein
MTALIVLALLAVLFGGGYAVELAIAVARKRRFCASSGKR